MTQSQLDARWTDRYDRLVFWPGHIPAFVYRKFALDEGRLFSGPVPIFTPYQLPINIHGRITGNSIQ